MDDVHLALALADHADELTMAAFTGEAVAFIDKPDGSPVTDTDCAVEVALRELVARHRPDDAFVGEETGGTATDGRRWIVDPIDGTASFAAGGRAWGTQLALLDGDELLVGATSAPAWSTRWWGAAGVGAFRRSADGHTRPLATATPEPGATLRWNTHPPLDALPGGSEWRALADRLVAIGPYVPPPLIGPLMVAEGELDVCLVLGGWPWDYAAMAATVTAAGGSFAYLDGSVRLEGMRPALFTAGRVRDVALAAFAG